MNKDDKYIEALHEINKETIIDSLSAENKQLKLQVEMLENIADKLNDYISDNNLKHRRFITENKTKLDYDLYKKLHIIVIPETRYIIVGEENE